MRLNVVRIRAIDMKYYRYYSYVWAISLVTFAKTKIGAMRKIRKMYSPMAPIGGLKLISKKEFTKLYTEAVDRRNDLMSCGITEIK